MPRWLRMLITGYCFAWFFGGSAVIGVLLFPLMRLVSWALGDRDGAKHRERCTRLLHHACGWFSWWMKVAGLIDYERPALPEGFPKGGYVLIANHPSLIDTVLLLGWFPGLTCVAKASWYESFVLGYLLRSTHYLPGKGYSGDLGKEGTPALDRMVEHLRSGHPLLVFPEGTRSGADQLRRFRRGACEAAIRAGVPIVPLFMHVDRIFLMRGQTWKNVPKARARFSGRLLPVIHPTPESDPRVLNRDLREELKARFEAMLEERRRREAREPGEGSRTSRTLTRGRA